MSKRITEDELEKILINHSHWLKEDCDGWEEMRANLSWTDLSRADLSGVNLLRADLSWANLSGADLSWAKNVPFIPYTCPDFGMFIGFKKAYTNSNAVIVVLEIPEDAKRLSATGRKCRCDKAKVIEIQSIGGEKLDISQCHSDYDNRFTYKVGEVVSVDNFCEDRWQECAPGIHFFINRQEAIDY